MLSVRPRYLVSGVLPLLLMLAIVIAGFSITLLRQNQSRQFSVHSAQHLQTLMVRKELAERLVSNLRGVSTSFYHILFSSDATEQQYCLDGALRRLGEIDQIIALLRSGGTLSLLADSNDNSDGGEPAVPEISYRLPVHHASLPDAIPDAIPDAMPAQLLEFKQQLLQALAVTAQRNQQLNNPHLPLDQQPGHVVRVYAAAIRQQLKVLLDNGQRTARIAAAELGAASRQAAAAHSGHQQQDRLWAFFTLLSVVGLLGFVYRKILTTQYQLNHAIDRRRQIEEQLRQSHDEVVALNSTLEDRVAQRTRQLRQSEQQWSDAFNAIRSAIFLHDKQGRIIKANRAYLELAGCSLPQALGCYYWQLFPRRDTPLPGCLYGQEYDSSCCQQLESLTIDDNVYLSQSITVCDGYDDYLYAMHLLQDVTAERQAQSALQQSEKRFRDVIDSMAEVLIMLDGELKVQILNKAALRYYKVSGDDYIGRACHQVLWDCGSLCEGCVAREVLASGCSARALRYLDDGTILDRTVTAVRDPQGQIVGCAVLAVDVTQREKYIGELKRYEQILSTNTDLIAFSDDAHIYLAANAVYAEYYATRVDDMIGKTLPEVIGAERYALHQRYHAQIFEDKKPISLCEWRDYPGRGRRYMHITFTPYIADDGSVGGLVTRSRDLTATYEQEARLHLYAKVFESTLEGIAILDCHGIIEVVNPAFCRITGYTEQEVLGQTAQLLKSQRHDAAFYAEVRRQLDATGQWQGEVWNRRKNGEVFPLLLTISTLNDNAGQVQRYVAVFSDITALHNVVEQLDYQAHHHSLTRLPNRRLLYVRLAHSIERAERDQQPGALFYLDLDNFKNINDSLGHAAGDQVLLEVAARLKQHCRQVDTVAHLSGDEFILVLDQVRSLDDVTFLAQQLLEQLKKPLLVNDYELFISASIGVTVFPADGRTVEELLKHADAAMYKAKERGKSCYHLYSPQLTDAALERVMLESYLRRALSKQELVVYYQPQVSLRSGDIVACEALVRWQHPKLGLVAPDKFIPLSEETGLIIAMGEWILRTACQQWVCWRDQGYTLQRIAVNLSGRQIQQKNLPRMVQQVLDETGCPAAALELEITESFLMKHPEQAITVLDEIRALGVVLSIDDFGTGQSSLNYLQRFPVQRLKIDRSFINDIQPGGENAIVKAIIAMGHGLNMQITAEGIENPQQKDFLARLRCDEAQGFLFSKPRPADEISQQLGIPL